MVNNKEMIRFFTFSQFHNKIPPAGSTHIRVMQLLKYWPEAELYKYGENPDVLIFQKVYAAVDYQFPNHFENLKILDICDPDWLDGLTGITETARAMDAITCPTEPLAEFMRQLTNSLVFVVKDRFDLAVIPEPKVHNLPAKTIVWFGYRHNIETLQPALKAIKDLGLNLLVIADDDPMVWQWVDDDAAETFRRSKYKFIKYNENTIYFDLQRADFAILPPGVRPIDPFKSDNKRTRAILAGLPVAHTKKELEEFIDPIIRRQFMIEHFETTKETYDVRKSVVQYQEIIKELRNGQNP